MSIKYLTDDYEKKDLNLRVNDLKLDGSFVGQLDVTGDITADNITAVGTISSDIVGANNVNVTQTISRTSRGARVGGKITTSSPTTVLTSYTELDYGTGLDQHFLDGFIFNINGNVGSSLELDNLGGVDDDYNVFASISFDSGAVNGKNLTLGLFKNDVLIPGTENQITTNNNPVNFRQIITTFVTNYPLVQGDEIKLKMISQGSSTVINIHNTVWNICKAH